MKNINKKHIENLSPMSATYLFGNRSMDRFNKQKCKKELKEKGWLLVKVDYKKPNKFYIHETQLYLGAEDISPTEKHLHELTNHYLSALKEKWLI